MSSLASCIKRAGKALTADDAAAIRQIHDDLAAAGVKNPAERAVSEYLDQLKLERDSLNAQIKEQGGRPPQTGVSLAKKTTRQIAEAISIVGLLDGDESLTIPGARTTKSGKIKAKASQLANALIARTRKANRGRLLDAMTPRSKEILAEALAIETEAALKRSGHAGDWYTRVLQNAVNIVSELHPELKTDDSAKTMFLLGLAITSNGQEVYSNSLTAEEVYDYFKKNGKFPLRSYGNQGAAMVDAFQAANEMIERWGLDTFAGFLNTKFTVEQLRALGFKINGENGEYETHGSLIFGPKVGGGFFQNLMGNYDPVTMDRWFMRTWGRLTGTLMPDQTQLPEGQKNRFVDAIKRDPKRVKELGWTVERATESDESLMEFAVLVHRAYQKSTSKYHDSYGEKTEIHKAGKQLDLSFNAPIISPANGSQRMWIREVSALALEKLQQRGFPVNGASMQALVWYPEKDLYLKHGVGNAKSAPTDYEQEFARIAKDRGVPQSRIDAARTSDTQQPGPAAARDDGRDAGPVADKAADAGALGTKGRGRLIRFEAVRRIRQQLPRAYRGSNPRGAERHLDGNEKLVTRQYKPQVKTKNAYGNAGLPTPVIVELDPTAGAALFYEKITAARKAHPKGSSVYVYPQEDYEGMRLFMTKDGSTGFALKGDDIVSVFKHPDNKVPGAIQPLIALAVSEGGRRLDAFDTTLPSIYSMQGFKVVARVGWNEEFKDPDWNKKDYADFNDGEPDVVYMVYDKNHQIAYTGRNEGTLVGDPDAAIALQDEAIAELEERNKDGVPNVLYALPEESRERINNNPTSPLARLHKMGATVEQQGNLPPANTTRNALLEAKRKMGIKPLLAALPRRYLADFMPERLAPSLARYLRLSNRLDGRRNELQSEYEKVAERWSKWAKKNQGPAAMLSEVMNAATLAGVDPTVKYKPLKSPEKMDMADKRLDTIRRQQHILLGRELERIGPEATEIFKEVRDSYLQMRKRVEKGLENRIKEAQADEKTKRAMLDLLRKKMEAGRVQGVYFPLMRYGQYWAVAKTKPDAEGNQEAVSFSRFENKSDMKLWAKEFREEGYEVTQGLRSENRADVVSQVDPGFAARVAQLVGGLEGGQEIADAVWQTYLMTLPEMSIRKQFMHRKGRLGFAADGLRAYANVSFRNANQLAKLEYMYRMDRELDGFYKEMVAVQNDPELDREFDWAMPIYDELHKRHKAQQNPDASPLAVAVTGAGFLWFLGFTPAAAMVNLSQTPLVALPWLSAEFNPVGATRELLRASTLYVGSRGKLENRLRGEERQAIADARKIGMFDKTQAHDLAGITEAGATGAYGGWQAQFMKVGSWLFHEAEQFNREVTFLAGYRLAKMRGDAHDDAVLLAEKATWDSHFDYNNANRPVFMQKDWGRVIFLFKQYSLNMTYRFTRDFRDGFLKNPNISAADKSKAKKRFAGMMMMAYTMAGYSGLPAIMTMPVKFLLEAMLSDEDDPLDAEDAMRVYLADLWGAEAAEWIMKGAVDGGMGITLSNRVSLGQLWWRDPNVNTEGKNLAQTMFLDLLGPVISTGLQGAGVAIDAARGELNHPERGLEMVTPKAVRDLIRAYRYSTEGALTQHIPQDTLVAKEDFTPMDVFWQAFGFTPARLTQQYEQNQALRNVADKLTMRRSQLLDKLSLAAFNDDKKEINAVIEEIGAFNQAQPTMMIGGEAIGSSLKSRARRNALNVGGVNLDKRLWHLYDELSFTDNERLPAAKPEE